MSDTLSAPATDTTSPDTILSTVTTMTAIDRSTLFKDILDLDLHNYPVSIFLASVVRNDAIPHFARLDVTEQLADDFRHTLGAFLHTYQKRLEENDLTFRDFSTEGSLDTYEVETFDISKYQPVLEQIDPLNAYSGIETFDNDEKFVAGMRFYVLMLQVPDSDPIYLFRVHTRQSILGRSTLLTLFNNKGAFDRIQESVMGFDQQFDCLCRSNILYIFDKRNFQHIFRYFDTIRHEARQTLTTINTNVPIQNLDEMIHACEGNVAMLQKLKRVSTKKYLQNIHMKDIKRVIEVHKLPVQIVEDNGQEKLLFDPKAKAKERYLLLRILNDDYLKSVMTDTNYEVTDKREM